MVMIWTHRCTRKASPKQEKQVLGWERQVFKLGNWGQKKKISSCRPPLPPGRKVKIIKYLAQKQPGNGGKSGGGGVRKGGGGGKVAGEGGPPQQPEKNKPRRGGENRKAGKKGKTHQTGFQNDADGRPVLIKPAV